MPRKRKKEHWSGMQVPEGDIASQLLGDTDMAAELASRAYDIARAAEKTGTSKGNTALDKAVNRYDKSFASFEKLKEKSPTGKSLNYKEKKRKKGGKVLSNGNTFVQNIYK